MPAAIASKEEVLVQLLATFRRDGYDGASLAEISKATGLGKSSLYHHFPNGKTQMAIEVLDHLATMLEQSLFAPMKANAKPTQKLDAMLDAIDAFYEGGKSACLLERLCASIEHPRFRKPLERAFVRWIEAIAELAIEARVKPSIARTRAEDAVVRIEGSLIVAAGTGDTKPFERALESIRRTLFLPEV
jgi:TetR/AcrR family transcriptional regulator, lmrAB and yxaGH operons repressor